MRGRSMYYEEQVINGILHWRSSPDGEWKPCRPEEITTRLLEAKSKSDALTAQLETCEHERNHAAKGHRGLEAQLAAVEGERDRLERELKAYRPKYPFVDSQLPPLVGDHPTVQIYREKVVEFRNRYVRLGSYLADILGVSFESLCELDLMYRQNKFEKQQARPPTPAGTGGGVLRTDR